MQYINTDKVLKVVFHDWKKSNFTYQPYEKSTFLKKEIKEGYYGNLDIPSFIKRIYKVNDENLPKHLKEINYELWIKPHYEVVLTTYESHRFYYEDRVEAESKAYKFLEENNIDFFVNLRYDK